MRSHIVNWGGFPCKYVYFETSPREHFICTSTTFTRAPIWGRNETLPLFFFEPYRSWLHFTVIVASRRLVLCSWDLDLGLSHGFQQGRYFWKVTFTWHRSNRSYQRSAFCVPAAGGTCESISIALVLSAFQAGKRQRGEDITEFLLSRRISNLSTVVITVRL